MKVTFANLNAGCVYENLTARVAVIEEALRGKAVDFFVFEEYVPLPELGRAVCKATGLKLAYYKEYSKSHVAQNASMGVAVFAADEVKEMDCHALVKPECETYYRGRREYFHDKYFIALSAKFKGGSVRILTGHGFSFNRYGLNPSDFPQTFEPLDSWLEKYSTSQSVLIGDFNAENVEELLPRATRERVDAFKGEASRPSGRKTDHLFYPAHGKCLNKANIRCGEGDAMLDHHLLIAELDI